jgi:putative ABC transport system permease protein
MIATWLIGLLHRRAARLGATAAGVAIAVALLATLGTFLATSTATMTDRATREVAVDWQVQVQPGASAEVVLDAVRTEAGTTVALPVRFAGTSGFTAAGSDAAGAAGTATAKTVQTTGPGVVLSVPAGYRAGFPDALRTLAGRGEGVLLAQQTAANLHARPGDAVSVARPGLPPATVTVDGIVSLPQADSLFQRVGAPPGSQPTAPPDNVLLLPQPLWDQVFEPVAGSHPELLATQVHAARDHRLPPDPSVAYVAALGAAHHLELRTEGAGLVGDNLAATLDKARSDAAYAQVLFLFLGLPGTVLAGLLTAAVAAAGGQRRRREYALLSMRGARTRQLLALAAGEAVTIGGAGAVIGLTAAALVGRLAFGSMRFGNTAAGTARWVVGAAAAGLLIAAAAVLLPALRDIRVRTVAAGRRAVGRYGAPRWTRYWPDAVLLAAGAAVFWVTSRADYQLVLAPEGVPAISVSYWAFTGPALVGLGSALLAWRVAEWVPRRCGRQVAALIAPLAGNLATTAATIMLHRRRALARSIVLLGLALAFAASTATFNATYRQQAEVDTQLTNGADVTVTQSPGTTVGPAAAGRLARVAGVRAVEPIQHRFAYVGADLQDLYGIDPSTITRATALSDRYFQDAGAAQLLDRLATAPDSILVSAETVKDFQLRIGDPVNLRLPDARTGALTAVVFHYAGIVTEFPTAPKDSFLVANAAYVAAATGSDAVGAFLVDTGGRDTGAVAARLRTLLGPGATISDVATVRGQIGSSLTAVDLAGLTRVELGFALLLAAAGGGLVLGLGMAERRRGYAVLSALGARSAQLRRLVLSEAVVVAVGGILTGTFTGWALSRMLVAVLTGVFDPPPDHLAVPWAYLATVTAVAVLALGITAALTTRLAARPDTALLREQ